jgi:hypothetical protein
VLANNSLARSPVYCFFRIFLDSNQESGSSHPTQPEMKFLDIILTKVSSLLLRFIHSPFYWRILKKTIIFPVLKILTKKAAKQEYSSLFMKNICIVEWKNEDSK